MPKRKNETQKTGSPQEETRAVAGPSDMNSSGSTEREETDRKVPGRQLTEEQSWAQDREKERVETSDEELGAA